MASPASKPANLTAAALISNAFRRCCSEIFARDCTAIASEVFLRRQVPSLRTLRFAGADVKIAFHMTCSSRLLDIIDAPSFLRATGLAGIGVGRKRTIIVSEMSQAPPARGWPDVGNSLDEVQRSIKYRRKKTGCHETDVVVVGDRRRGIVPKHRSGSMHASEDGEGRPVAGLATADGGEFRDSFLGFLDRTITWFAVRAWRNQWSYNGSRIALVILSASLPVLVTNGMTALSTPISILVAILAALEAQFKPGEQWKHQRSAELTLKGFKRQYEHNLAQWRARPGDAAHEPLEVLYLAVETFLKHEPSEFWRSQTTTWPQHKP